MKLSIESPPKGSLQITIVEKRPDGTCRVHTYSATNGMPQVSIVSLHIDEPPVDHPELLALSS